MEEKMKVRWVKALRSKKYKQGSGWLRANDNTYCCLGVLCDLVDRKGWSKPENGSYTFYRGSAHYLPSEICETYDIRLSETKKLTGMNDSGVTFSTIATWIEDHL